MTEEEKDKVYGRLIREYQSILQELAACGSELTRVGENFRALGTDLIDRPGALALDKPSFDIDVALVPKLLDQYSGLVVKKSDKQLELETFGPRPSF